MCKVSVKNDHFRSGHGGVREVDQRGGQKGGESGVRFLYLKACT